MREFFRGWKRKVGFVFLIMACALTILWFRGQVICDIATFGGLGGYWQLYASRYGLQWITHAGDPEITYGDPFRLEHHAEGKANGPHPPEFHLGGKADNQILWKWQWNGFLFAEFIWLRDKMKITIWAVPYWSIILPLTLLSAWLLLTRSRARNKQMIPATIETP